MKPKSPETFAQAAARPASHSLLREYIAFLKQHKKLWMVPLILLLILLGALIVFGGSAAAPFMYPLF